MLLALIAFFLLDFPAFLLIPVLSFFAEENMLPYTGLSFPNLFTLLYKEISILLGICAALLFLAAKLNKITYFLDQKKMSIFLTKFFSLFLLLQGMWKMPLFWNSQNLGYNAYFLVTEYTCFLESLVLLTGGFILYSSIRLIQNNVTQHLMEYPILFALSIWFLLLLVISNNLVITFIGLVGFSLNLYVMLMLFGPSFGVKGMLNYKINPAARHEASIKYFYLSTFSSALVLLSVLIFYTLSRTTNLIELNYWLTESLRFWQTKVWFSNWIALENLAILAFIIGFAFKMSAFPSHFWAPEVYQGSSNSVTAFIILPVKVAALGAFTLILFFVWARQDYLWQQVILLISIGSMLLGAFGAFGEKKIKRFLAYSSINQVGFLLLGLSTTKSLAGIQATLFFLTIYVITNLLFFYFFLQTESKQNSRPLVYLTDLNRLSVDVSQHTYKIKIAWTVVFLSLAGLPPFAGFFSKLFVLLTAQNSQHYFAVFVGIATSLISAYYYLRVVKLLWFEQRTTPNLFVFTPGVQSSRIGQSLYSWAGLLICAGLGLLLTCCFLWDDLFLTYCLGLAHSCAFPLQTLGDFSEGYFLSWPGLY